MVDGSLGAAHRGLGASVEISRSKSRVFLILQELG